LRIKKAEPPKPPKRRRRYSIGEWYGRPLAAISPAERLLNARAEIEVDSIRGLYCPFQRDTLCNKKFGVCSLQLYEQIGKQPVTLTGPLVTTCPNRFLEDDIIFRWIAEEILRTSDPIVLRQIGFLYPFERPESGIALEPTAQNEFDDDKRDNIGRIDNVLVHPSKTPIDWCAVELQAVYFSGKAMKHEFKMLSEAEIHEIPFPAAPRRPDFRSSGPKRLLPQLQTKIPDISNWGKRMAVVIDEAFFETLIGLEPVKHLSNAQIAWCVVKYERQANNWRLVPKEIVLSKLDSSVKALTGGVPLSQDEFENQLREKLPEAFRQL
jgi:hypothetical protein